MNNLSVNNRANPLSGISYQTLQNTAPNTGLDPKYGPRSGLGAGYELPSISLKHKSAFKNGNNDVSASFMADNTISN